MCLMQCHVMWHLYALKFMHGNMLCLRPWVLVGAIALGEWHLLVRIILVNGLGISGSITLK